MTRDEVKEWLKRKRDFRYQFITVDTSSKCTLSCPVCVRQWNIEKGIHPGENGRDIPVSDIEKLSRYFISGSLCGTVSDPIFCDNLISVLKTLKGNPYWLLHTAATAKHRDVAWYKEAFLANPDMEWIFGIDGLPEESHKYRVGQDGPFLYEMMKLAKSMGLRVRWQYLIFKYNENNVERARFMAMEEDIEFNAVRTLRVTEKLRPTDG